MINGYQATILLYVDDMLIAHRSKEVVQSIMDEIDNKYGKGTRSEGQVMEFLGMRIEKDRDGSVLVSMPRHIADLLEAWNIDKTSEYPAGHNLFEIHQHYHKNYQLSFIQGWRLVYLFLNERQDLMYCYQSTS
jgi:hypothetical protein